MVLVPVLAGDIRICLVADSFPQSVGLVCNSDTLLHKLDLFHILALHLGDIFLESQKLLPRLEASELGPRG